MAPGARRAAIDTETERAHKLTRGSGLRAHINSVEKTMSQFSNEIYANSFYTLPPNMP